MVNKLKAYVNMRGGSIKVDKSLTLFYTNISLLFLLHYQVDSNVKLMHGAYGFNCLYSMTICKTKLTCCLVQ